MAWLIIALALLSIPASAYIKKPDRLQWTFYIAIVVVALVAIIVKVT